MARDKIKGCWIDWGIASPFRIRETFLAGKTVEQNVMKGGSGGFWDMQKGGLWNRTDFRSIRFPKRGNLPKAANPCHSFPADFTRRIITLPDLKNRSPYPIVFSWGKAELI